MILTFNVRHNRDLTALLLKAKAVAEYELKNKCRSSARVSQFGLKSTLSNQILRKYVNNSKCKKISHIVIPVISQSFHWDGQNIEIPCLKENGVKFIIPFSRENIIKPIHIELDENYAHVACEVSEVPQIKTVNYLGVDRNTTQHVVVASDLNTGKVLKLGKECQHIHAKYSHIRRAIQRDAVNHKHHKYRKIKKLKRRESHIIKSINHQISRKIVDYAVENKCKIVFEKLQKMRYERKKKKNKVEENKKSQDKRYTAKSFRYSLNSWSYNQLAQFVEYKAQLLGVPVVYVPPQYTSQTCSKCGAIGERDGKTFECPYCGHVDHADANAGFNIAMLGKRGGRLTADRDAVKGSTNAPNGAMG